VLLYFDLWHPDLSVCERRALLSFERLRREATQHNGSNGSNGSKASGGNGFNGVNGFKGIKSAHAVPPRGNTDSDNHDNNNNSGSKKNSYEDIFERIGGLASHGGSDRGDRTEHTVS
jgi:hypothetical protein